MTRHAGYAVSLGIRKRIEEAFGWGKEIGTMRRTRFKGLACVGLPFSSQGRDGVRCVTANLDCAFDKTKCDVSFDFTGSDEGDQVSDQGWAEMSGPNTIEGEFEFHQRRRHKL